MNSDNKQEELLKRPIIIFGTGRSGTTIISDIIFQHEDLAWHSNYQELFPKFAGINYFRKLFDNKWWRKIGMNTQNNKSFFNYICFRPIERYDFWEYITGPKIDFSRDFLINKVATATEKKFMRSFFARMVQYQQRKRLAFKITGPARMEYLMSVFPDAIFVNVIRDPVSTVRSWLEVQWSEQITDQLWWQGAYSPKELEQAKELSKDPALFAAFQYRKIMETTDAEIAKLHPDLYIARYENFVANPHKFISEMMNYLGLVPSKLVDEYMEKISVKNRNDREAKSDKTNISEETKKKILDIVNQK